jgi:hypothetical protein
MSRLWLGTPLGESREMFEDRHGKLLFANIPTGPVKRKVPCISKVPCMAKIDWPLALLRLPRRSENSPEIMQILHETTSVQVLCSMFSSTNIIFEYRQTQSFRYSLFHFGLRTNVPKNTQLGRNIYILTIGHLSSSNLLSDHPE